MPGERCCDTRQDNAECLHCGGGADGRWKAAWCVMDWLCSRRVACYSPLPVARRGSDLRALSALMSGALREWHPISLGATVVDALVERSGVDANLIEDVIVGCVSQVGAQAGNIGRNIVLASTLPEHVPGTAVDRQCGSSQQAIHFAAQAVMSGVQDVVIAAGVEHMTSVPIGANVADAVPAGHGVPNSDEIKAKYGAALEARGQKFFSQVSSS